jgi:hypothetical protein
MIGTPFIPFYGFVEDVNDPEKLGRVRVRVVSYHSENKSVLPTDQLKWFMCVVNNSESQAGIGTNPKYNMGSMVFGYFIDQTLQNGMIIGSLNGMPDGENDINKLARNESIDQTIIQQKRDSMLKNVNVVGGGKWSEPETPYNTQYPNNKVTQSNSGHVTECDDTEGAERLHVYHRSGSFYELHPDGSQVVRIVKDNYSITAGDNFLYVDGDINMTVNGNLNQHITGDHNIQVDGNRTEVVLGNLKQNIGREKSTLASGGYAVDGATIDLNSGKASGNSGIPVILSPEYDVEAARAIINSAGRYAALDEESEIGSTPSTYPEDAPPDSFDGEVKEESDVQGEEKIAEPILCSTKINDGNINSSMSLGGTKFTIGELSNNAVFAHTIRDQAGLTKQDIVCNLESLAKNILQPLYDEYGKFTINSGFRIGSGRSQHELGQAVDIQNSSWSYKKYLEVAEWITENLKPDSVILEHGKSIWLHISYNGTSKTQRGKVLTMISGKFEKGLRLYYV